jgi:hypothetical protein
VRPWPVCLSGEEEVDPATGLGDRAGVEIAVPSAAIAACRGRDEQRLIDQALPGDAIG